MIFLVRHAKAGHRSDANPDDSKRPLTSNGWAQAKALADALIDAGAKGSVHASPFTRCVQTVEPVAERLGVAVTPDRRLAESQPLKPLIELIESSPDGTVLCSHGDMIPDVMQALDRRGIDFTTAPNWKKGSVWALTRNDDGTVVSAAAWPPPEV